MFSLLLNSKLYVAGSIVGLMATGIFAPAQTSGGPKPVFIHANCDGKTAAVVGSLKDQIVASRKYVMTPTLDDNGKMDEVFEVYMRCAQRDDIVAVATSYGKGRCLSTNKCGSVVDGSSIRSALCDASAAADCGRTLFEAFDGYMSSPRLPLKPN
jgi:hypothetical protein